MKTLTRLQILNKIDSKEKSFKVIILDCKYNKNSYSGKILGLTLAEWIKFESGDFNCEIIKYNEKENILDFVSNNLDQSDYTIVLLSKTPLITNNTLKNIKEYAEYKDINLCKLPLGYVIKNQSIESRNIDSVYSHNIEDFYIVETKAQYNYAQKILQERINNFHINNGVDIISPDKVYIEPTVDIDKGAVIYPNNSLKGKSFISRDVILKENNVIENSKIGKNSCISGSVIVDTAIGENVYISAFCEIKNSLIGGDSLIEKGVSMSNYHLPINSKVKPNEILGDNNDSDNRARKSR